MKKIAHFAGEWVKSNFLGERDLNNNKIQKAVIINFPSLLAAGRGSRRLNLYSFAILSLNTPISCSGDEDVI